MQEPLKMADGNWIMAGFQIKGAEGNPPAVAISHGNNLRKWDLCVLPVAPHLVST
jgi:hypothetical protein